MLKQIYEIFQENCVEEEKDQTKDLGVHQSQGEEEHSWRGR